jgi:chemotaxis family two-component system sensor kinase Cph1
MPEFIVNIDNCDQEPIHIPGQIQSHGFLIVINQSSQIEFISANTESFLQADPSKLLGKSITAIEEIIDYKMQPEFISNLLLFGKGDNFEQANPYEFKLSGFPFYLIISKSDNYYLLEFELVGQDSALDIQKQMGKSLAAMLGDKSLTNLLHNSAQQIRSIIRFDRIMIYKFAEDGHGEVVSEAKADHLASWIGLHYPASDIPNQARELYKKNLTRLIADVAAQPSKILTSHSENDHLDLTNSQLRAVSPIHIQYLKNMGVASSFSISLMYKGELWGLIACHNYTARFIDYKARESAKLIGQILSSALEFRQDEEDQLLTDSFNKSVDKLSRLLVTNDTIAQALLHEDANLLDIVKASGALLIHDNTISHMGITPDPGQTEDLLVWIKENIKDSIYHTNSLSKDYPAATEFKGIASGMMVCTLSKDLSEFIIWFKPEIVQTIKWAGDPNKPFEFTTDGKLQISPRHSFDLWMETVTGSSHAWSNLEIRSVKQLRDEIIYSLNQKANTLRLLNERLKLAYDELDTFSYTISHDLKNPLAVIKSYTQLLLRDKTIGEQGTKFLTRIAFGAEKMQSLITEVLDYSRIGRSEIENSTIDAQSIINEIIADQRMIYDSEHLKVHVGDLPNLTGEKTMILQVFTNLISNAFKYSQNAEYPEVFIDGKVINDEVRYCISDNGIGVDPKDHHRLFELFQRMENAKEIEGTGVGLSIVKRIIEKHGGQIWIESEIGKGSTFFVTLKHYS